MNSIRSDSEVTLSWVFMVALLLAPMAAAFDDPAELAPIKAVPAGAGDNFGKSVAISGNTLVVGADQEDSNATGVNGDAGNDSAGDSGAAYVFIHNGTQWVQQAYLKPSNTGAGDAFGRVVAISGDTLVVGAPGEDSNARTVNGEQGNNAAASSGAAYVFVRVNGNWTQQAYLKASNADAYDEFGTSVAIAGDTLVVGAHYESSSATGIDGDQGNNLGGLFGAAYVFVRSNGVWTQQAYLKPSNPPLNHQFGNALALDGNTLIVGAHSEGNSATGVNGNQNAGSALQSGAAYVFVRSGSVWSQQAYLKASNTDAGDLFGTAVAIQGDTAVVGARAERSLATGINGNEADNTGVNCGAAYVFARTGGVWSQQAYLKGSNTTYGDRFGNSAAVWGDLLVVGATGESSPNGGINGTGEFGAAGNAGALYVYKRVGGAWTQLFYAKASPPVGGASLGRSVALSASVLASGAGAESAATANGSGVVYLFGEASPEPPEMPPQLGPLLYTYDPLLESPVVTMQAVGEANARYDILRTFDAAMPVQSWEFLGETTAQADGSISFTDATPYTDGGFYLLRRVPEVLP